MDFIIIGVTKAGTTSLAEALIEHKSIGFAKREIHFFDRSINNFFCSKSSSDMDDMGGTDNSSSHGRDYNFLSQDKKHKIGNITRDYEQELSNFGVDDASNNYDVKKYVGEKTPNMILKPEAVRLLAFMYPNVKILFVLREPISRMMSHFFFILSNVSVRKQYRKLEHLYLKE